MRRSSGNRAVRCHRAEWCGATGAMWSRCGRCNRYFPHNRRSRMMQKGFGGASTLKESLQIGRMQPLRPKMTEKPIGRSAGVAV
ncbi:hypothetical protein FTUN_0869 [Frigoriglobus tundricola]|uniref:Uncharacterized protein n=1 Tax=Frigoriglobus tundricola TaxID=2774151 RepID=A0A6M5YJB9_9BACT|nr:hypothetical protein FTUN_0869 [Frigoriglobus tundricola]